MSFERAQIIPSPSRSWTVQRLSWALSVRLTQAISTYSKFCLLAALSLWVAYDTLQMRCVCLSQSNDSCVSGCARQISVSCYGCHTCSLPLRHVSAKSLQYQLRIYSWAPDSLGLHVESSTGHSCTVLRLLLNLDSSGPLT